MKWLATSWMVGLWLLSCRGAVAKPNETPQSLDDRLTVELFASEPDVVTVTGLTVDLRGRVLVVESHTHFRPEGYQGPATDRIRLLEDTDGDGRADRFETFFSGTRQTMNLAAHPNGWIYVATRNLVFRIRDTDGDDRADEREDLVQFQTTSDYPHNGISGFAFDFQGNVFISLGENMGEDGTLVAGDVRLPANRGAGGIFRCRPDGSELRRVAVGFWNPFHLCFDAYGRLFTGDNDPGNRPPCRFLSIVEGGDYGYRRRTLEPFIAINGEVPGTLPMTSSTGESPTGMVAYESTHLPPAYRGDVLVASWGEHRIDRYQLKRTGASFEATTQVMIAGGESFRPAGIAVAPDGSLYIGDWADRSYELHGKGRVWHVRAKTPAKYPVEFNGIQSSDRATRETAARRLIDSDAGAQNSEGGRSALVAVLQNDPDPRVRSTALAALVSGQAMTPELASLVRRDPSEAIREQAARTLPMQLADPVSTAKSDASEAVQAEALRRVSDPAAEALLLECLDHPDPFYRHAARRGLSQSTDVARLAELVHDGRAAVRLAAVLLLRDEHSETLDPQLRDEWVQEALNDVDADVLRATVQWIGRDELTQFRDELAKDLARKAITPELLTAYLAALAQLDGVMQHWTNGKVGDWWIEQADAHRNVLPMLDDPTLPPAVLTQLLRVLPSGHPAWTEQRLSNLLSSTNIGLQIEAVGKWRHPSGDKVQRQLAKIVDDTRFEGDVRAEAVVGIDGTTATGRDQLLEWVDSQNPAIRDEALRGLRVSRLDDSHRSKLNKMAKTDQAAADLVAKILRSDDHQAESNSEDLDWWEAHLDGPADAQAGRRIFFHPQGPGCANCHRIDGRGHAVGPALARARGTDAFSKRRLIEAILWPSKDIDPGYLPLQILTIDGRVASGIYFRHGGGVRQIINSQGEIESFDVADIEEIQPSNRSIMPDGLSSQMTTQELRDLLAYLLAPDQDD